MMSATSHPKFGDAAIPADLARRLLDEAIAVLLPGMGQVFNGTATRGLMMVFSMLTLGWVRYHLTTPEHSVLGRYAGGIFIYAVSILDAYRWARYRWEIFTSKQRACALTCGIRRIGGATASLPPKGGGGSAERQRPRSFGSLFPGLPIADNRPANSTIHSSRHAPSPGPAAFFF